MRSLKSVASAILGGRGGRHPCRPNKTPGRETHYRFSLARSGVALFPPGWEARLYGRQGCPPLRFEQAVSRKDVVDWGERASRVLPSPSRRGLPADACVFTKWLLVCGRLEVLGGTRALPNPITWFRLSAAGEAFSFLIQPGKPGQKDQHRGEGENNTNHTQRVVFFEQGPHQL